MPLGRDRVVQPSISFFFSELQQLLTPPVRLSPEMEDWLKTPIPNEKKRPLFKGTGGQAAAIRKVRLDWALGIIYEYTPGKPRNGDLLSHKIGNRLYALQQRLIDQEQGRPPARFEQEARNALTANNAEDTTEVREICERIWGPLRNP